MLDQFLTLIPDKPELPDAKPGGLTLNRKPSNSIPDWVRTLNLNMDEIPDNDECIDDDDMTDHLLISNSNVDCTNCITGSWQSQGHGL